MNKEGEDDDRREAAIASNLCLHSNVDSKLRGVTQQQLSKFQELHQRRLQIKAKSKIKKKSQDSYETRRVTLEAGVGTMKDLESGFEEQILPGSESSTNKSSLSCHNSTGHHAPEKRQKLYWGLDTKERWERKANM